MPQNKGQNTQILNNHQRNIFNYKTPFPFSTYLKTRDDFKAEPDQTFIRHILQTPTERSALQLLMGHFADC